MTGGEKKSNEAKMINKSGIIFSPAEVEFDATCPGFMFITSQKEFAVVWVMLGHN